MAVFLKIRLFYVCVFHALFFMSFVPFMPLTSLVGCLHIKKIRLSPRGLQNSQSGMDERHALIVLPTRQNR